MNIEEIIKKAYKEGKIKDASEAWKEFPPEEWHKGKIENVLNENIATYSPYEIGDIVFVKEYYYNASNKGENHLFVIVYQDNIAVPIENFGMILSSKISKVKYKTNVLLPKDSYNNLNKDSIEKTDQLYKLDDKQILFRIGKVDKQKVEQYLNLYEKYNL